MISFQEDIRRVERLGNIQKNPIGEFANLISRICSRRILDEIRFNRYTPAAPPKIHEASVRLDQSQGFGNQSLCFTDFHCQIALECRTRRQCKSPQCRLRFPVRPPDPSGGAVSPLPLLESYPSRERQFDNQRAAGGQSRQARADRWSSVLHVRPDPLLESLLRNATPSGLGDFAR